MPRRKHPMPPRINVLVTVDDDHIEGLDAVTQDLEAAGMRVGEVFPVSGTIAGVVASHDVPKLRTVDGVTSVDEEPVFRAS